MRKLSLLVTLISLFFFFCLGIGFFILNHNWIDFSQFEVYNPGRPSILLDDQGKEWARYSLDKRQPITYEKIPFHVIQAFMAAEDHNFFSHQGISYRGIIRSLFVNLYHRRIVQGASTITQQLVKLLYTDCKRTFQRKIKDQLYALLVERQYTKEQIMQTYLNNVCFGRGIYGVKAASQRFWGKSVQDLTIDEAATLAGIVQSPARYCPLSHPEVSQKRRNVILNSMKSLDFIAEGEYQRLIEKEIILNPQESDQLAPHLKEMLRAYLEDLVGKKELYTGGLTIKTTINVTVQKIAEECFKNHVKKLKEELNASIDGGLLSVDTKTGHVRAMVGGYDFSKSKFNRAWQAKRQIASIFKPVVFAAAVEEGANFAETEVDEPFRLQVGGTSWEPRNANDRFLGRMSLAKALSHSNNIVTIKTLLRVGCQKIVDLAQKFRIQEKLKPYPSLSLGCIDATVKEVVGMFNVFANHGIYVEPIYLEWIKDKWGSKIYKVEQDRERILSSRVSGQVAKVLSIGLSRARKRANGDWFNADSIGKTGTTNDSRTLGFIGSTPELTTAVYIGCDDNKSVGKVFGVTTAFPIWKNMMMNIPIQKSEFSFDPSLKEYLIDGRTGAFTDKDNSQALAILM